VVDPTQEHERSLPFVTEFGNRSALRLGRRLAEHVGRPTILAGEPLTPRASFGVAWAPNGAAIPEALVAYADAAMYEAKAAGDGAPVLHGRR
jgi:GGDEF domain-containing protein